ncbi:29783_t:CDS:2, partial [Racocetra persica]
VTPPTPQNISRRSTTANNQTEGVIHALYWVFYDIERSQIEQSQD